MREPTCLSLMSAARHLWIGSVSKLQGSLALVPRNVGLGSVNLEGLVLSLLSRFG